MPDKSNNLTDEQLVALVRTRDKELYSEIIRRYEAKLTHYLRRFVQSNDQLEDILQEVFIKAYKNLFAFDINKKFSSWIYRIAHNEAINQLKKFSRESFSLDDSDWEIVDEKMDIKYNPDKKILKERLERALGKLKTKYSEALVWYYFEEKTYEEIGEIMRLPVSSVGTLISRGKKFLKKYLEYEK